MTFTIGDRVSLRENFRVWIETGPNRGYWSKQKYHYYRIGTVVELPSDEENAGRVRVRWGHSEYPETPNSPARRHDLSQKGRTWIKTTRLAKED